MKIALVNPITRRSQGYHTVGSYIPQLGLQVLARLTPPQHTVDIIDECFGLDQTERLLLTGGYDLVGITAYTSGATRAYELAGICRAKGIATIMGGPHASARPDEAAGHFDSVAIGECDEIWPRIIEDAAAGRLAPRYEGELSDLETTGFGMADQTLSPINGRYDVSALQTSRGCPVGCEYCSVTRFNGAPIRRRRIDDIIDEWNRTPKKFIFVVDDNFFGVGEKHAIWAKELLRQIIKRGKKRLWFSQTTLNMGEDEEGLRLAYQAGCRGMLVGFESFNEATLRQYAKGINRKNLDRYQELVDGFHHAGISVFGGFIIGSDEDTPESVAETARTAVELGIDIIQVTNLTPLPGTKMFDRYAEAGRLLATEYPSDWERYTFTETVYHPQKMSARELDEAIYELRYAAAREPWVWKRAFRTLVRTRSLTTAGFVLGMNRGWKRMARVQAPRDAENFGFTPPASERMQKVLRSFRMHLRSRFTPPVVDAPPAAAPSGPVALDVLNSGPR
ncbi:MAG: B12-binding domain-containing radical SAM protein [Phycisphaerales bacterium]|nr:B12-binding domain-containing radical SAM protein [Phycisphaerales bacterium]